MGEGTGRVTVQLSDLLPLTAYLIRAYAGKEDRGGAFRARMRERPVAMVDRAVKRRHPGKQEHPREPGEKAPWRKGTEN